MHTHILHGIIRVKSTLFLVERCVAVRRIKDHSKTNNVILHNTDNDKEVALISLKKAFRKISLT